MKPLLISGFGRSGTTALMSLVGSSPRVAFDRAYPFENRYLTYLAKLAVLLERQDPNSKVTALRLFDFADHSFGSYPWPADTAARVSASEWLRRLWDVFGASLAQAAPGTGFYAEKAPHWLSALVRETVPASTIYLFRDPRDVFLSANAFMQKRGWPDFDRSPSDTDLDYARTLAHRFLCYFENYLADCSRADCFPVRYEDMISQRDNFTQLIERRIGIECRWENAPWLETHRTTPDLSLSVERWRREPIPPDVDSVLQQLLGPAMTRLGYPMDVQVPPPPMVDFRASAFDTARALVSGGQIIPRENDAAAVIETGDFWIAPPLPIIEAAAVRETWVCLKGASGDLCSIYWRDAQQDFAEERSVHVPFHGGAHWQVIRFRVADHPLWKGTIAQLRFDPFNWREGAPATPQSGLIRWLRLIE